MIKPLRYFSSPILKFLSFKIRSLTPKTDYHPLSNIRILCKTWAITKDFPFPDLSWWSWVSKTKNWTSRATTLTSLWSRDAKRSFKTSFSGIAIGRISWRGLSHRSWEPCTPWRTTTRPHTSSKIRLSTLYIRTTSTPMKKLPHLLKESRYMISSELSKCRNASLANRSPNIIRMNPLWKR